ncbi:hypothetical protein NP493_430g03035 [Ridgeia piscesae]|uniref:Kinesin motor domain-containing protein n=1 Tax=Ridgeia piscesae TaxID=27915 RepID=A0AAD9NS30_RIDPI|nr:hypothetical protein NP493_430g03035 [Ridgeia piscesae]
MDDNMTAITNTKIAASANECFGKERVKQFTYDFSYWSADFKDDHYVSQEKVYEDLGKDVVGSAYQGYNACVFAYGQTGSGKTHTMMGSTENFGLIPRICESLFEQMQESKVTYRTEVSYLEIYNERVLDLLRGPKDQHQNLRVREHPKEGPYVQDLSKHLVVNYDNVQQLITKGNTNRTTATTNMNDASSRSHAIFTITFTQREV